MQGPSPQNSRIDAGCVFYGSAAGALVSLANAKMPSKGAAKVRQDARRNGIRDGRLAVAKAFRRIAAHEERIRARMPSPLLAEKVADGTRPVHVASQTSNQRRPVVAQLVVPVAQLVVPSEAEYAAALQGDVDEAGDQLPHFESIEDVSDDDLLQLLTASLNETGGAANSATSQGHTTADARVGMHAVFACGVASDSGSSNSGAPASAKAPAGTDTPVDEKLKHLIQESMAPPSNVTSSAASQGEADDAGEEEAAAAIEPTYAAQAAPQGTAPFSSSSSSAFSAPAQRPHATVCPRDAADPSSSSSSSGGALRSMQSDASTALAGGGGAEGEGDDDFSESDSDCSSLLSADSADCSDETEDEAAAYRVALGAMSQEGREELRKHVVHLLRIVQTQQQQALQQALQQAQPQQATQQATQAATACVTSQLAAAGGLASLTSLDQRSSELESCVNNAISGSFTSLADSLLASINPAALQAAGGTINTSAIAAQVEPLIYQTVAAVVNSLPGVSTLTSSTTMPRNVSQIADAAMAVALSIWAMLPLPSPILIGVINGLDAPLAHTNTSTPGYTDPGSDEGSDDDDSGNEGSDDAGDGEKRKRRELRETTLTLPKERLHAPTARRTARSRRLADDGAPKVQNGALLTAPFTGYALSESSELSTIQSGMSSCVLEGYTRIEPSPRGLDYLLWAGILENPKPLLPKDRPNGFAAEEYVTETRGTRQAHYWNFDGNPDAFDSETGRMLEVQYDRDDASSYLSSALWQPFPVLIERLETQTTPTA